MSNRYLKSAVLASAMLAAMQASATTINAVADGRWYQFDADEYASTSGGLEWIDGIVDSEGLYSGDGSELGFTFTLTNAATLTVVDAGFGGDEFRVTVNGQNYFTSTPSATDFNSIGTDFDAALADSQRFSYLNLLLNPGTYTVSGELLASALDEYGSPINATVGGLRVSEVPVPAAAWLFISAIAAGAGFVRRRLA